MKMSPWNTSWPLASLIATLWETDASPFWKWIENGLSAGASRVVLSNATSLAASSRVTAPGTAEPALPDGAGVAFALAIWSASQVS